MTKNANDYNKLHTISDSAYYPTSTSLNVLIYSFHCKLIRFPVSESSQFNIPSPCPQYLCPFSVCARLILQVLDNLFRFPLRFLLPSYGLPYFTNTSFFLLLSNFHTLQIWACILPLDILISYKVKT